MARGAFYWPPSHNGEVCTAAGMLALHWTANELTSSHVSCVLQGDPDLPCEQPAPTVACDGGMARLLEKGRREQRPPKALRISANWHRTSTNDNCGAIHFSCCMLALRAGNIAGSRAVTEKLAPSTLSFALKIICCSNGFFRFLGFWAKALLRDLQMRMTSEVTLTVQLLAQDEQLPLEDAIPLPVVTPLF
eukprot:CAMPEP_0117473280 /NCGR_PEP_ID=MMETSP0784-20121206/8692_1 /TAXON_ID=39447 /ORGANISM="" /LENGTH=190 /DNA_ID=CAMNT_0005267479 /DNA_START=928 /DNA_END=1502 /DNA_ORIENTATION=-